MSSTDRLYHSVQQDFLRWCKSSKVRQPAKPEAVAEYLKMCQRVHGPSSVIMRVSALAKQYRDQGRVFDTKAPVIQDVLMTARAQIRDRQTNRPQ